MKMMPTEPREWFAFRIRPRHEKMVATALRSKGYEEFLPLVRSKRKWGDRSKVIDLPLFPGYVFCDIERTEIGRIRSTPGVVDVVRAGSVPLPAERSEIESVRQALSAELPVESWPYLDPSTTGRVHIASGPMAGLDGILMEVRGRERLVLSIDLLRQSVLVEVPASSVVVCQEEVPARRIGLAPTGTG